MRSASNVRGRGTRGLSSLRWAATAVAVGGALAAMLGAPAAAAHQATHRGLLQHSSPPARVQRVCGRPARPALMACLALRVVGSDHQRLAPGTLPKGYGPGSLRSAYKLDASGGAGQTVAIVDAYNDPTAEGDLATYRSTYGLPSCTTANGCFRKVNQRGVRRDYPRNDAHWSSEISLDLDMVSAVCPRCRILLVEADSAAGADLGASVDTAVRLGAKFVSNSYGGYEGPGDTILDRRYFRHDGVVVTASSGDAGFGPMYPATSPYVTAVGGTTLVHAASARGWRETVWNGAGSGCSSYQPRPLFQSAVQTGCGRRAEADVAAVANPRTGVAVYQTYGGSGWGVFGGTSASSPIVASTYALAGKPGAGEIPASYPYAHAGDLFDVTTGSNGRCGAFQLCHARRGWDGPTGLGTPHGTAAFVGPRWSRSLDLGMRPMLSTPTAVAFSDGEQYVFWAGESGALREAHWTGSDWVGPITLGMGPLGSDPAVAASKSHHLFVFWRGTDKSLQEAYWNGKDWVGPQTVGAWDLASAPTVAVGQDNTEYVFWKGADSRLQEARWVPGRGWVGPAELARDVVDSQPAAGVDAAGHQYVYWRQAGNGIVETYWAGGWKGPKPIPSGKVASWPTAAVTPDGGRYVFWKGFDGDLHELYWNGSTWSGPIDDGHGPLVAPPGAAADSSHRLYVFWSGTDAHLMEAHRSAGL